MTRLMPLGCRMSPMMLTRAAPSIGYVPTRKAAATGA